MSPHQEESDPIDEGITPGLKAFKISNWANMPAFLSREPTLKLLSSAELSCTSLAVADLDAVQPIIFDGHCVVDNGNQLVEIPVEVIAALSASGLVFVQRRPGTIVEQRLKDVTRPRPARSVEEIELHQNRAMSVCAEYAKRFDAGDETSFASAVRSILAIGK